MRKAIKQDIEMLLLGEVGYSKRAEVLIGELESIMTLGFGTQLYKNIMVQLSAAITRVSLNGLVTNNWM